jgi:hypothetical protein
VELNHRATPVFTDDSGTRARITQWMARVLCGVVAVAVGALIVSLAMHVPLPGLGRNLAVPGFGGSHGSTRDGASDNGGSGLAGVSASGPNIGSAVIFRATPGSQSFATRSSHSTPRTPNPHPTGRTPMTRPPGRTPTTHPKPGTPNPHSAGHRPNPHSTAHKPNLHSTAAKSRRALRPHFPGSRPATHHVKKPG